MFRTRQALSLEAAESMAAQGLAFLAEDPARLSRFLAATGLTPDQIREQVNAPQFLAGFWSIWSATNCSCSYLRQTP